MRLMLVALLLCLGAAAQAQPADLAGFTDKSGHWVEVDSLVYRLGLARHPGYGGQCLALEPHADLCPYRDLLGRNVVFVSGRRVKVKEKEGQLFVLWEEIAPLVKSSPPLAGCLPPVRLPVGQSYDSSAVVLPGRTTVVFFYTQYCPSCWKFFPFMEAWNRSHPEVALLEADIDEFGSAMSDSLQVRAVPTLRIYDPQGVLVGEGKAAEDWFTRTYHLAMPTALKCVGSHKPR